MRLERLEVQNFRGIRSATIEFGPAITVLHGPNELGKSTLVEAIQAALFQQTNLKAGDEHVTWDSSLPACVTLTFEHQGKLWRVSKQFGVKTSAKLESSAQIGTPKFHEELTGKGVEGKLRELLSWGIAPPGKGAPKSSESFLLTALLGRQGEVQEVLKVGLDDDGDETGKSLVTQALGALDKDPLVSQIMEKLATRVDAVFAPQGALKKAADSPLVRLQDRYKAQHQVLEQLQQDERKGQDIQAEVVKRQDERERLLGEVDAATAGFQYSQEQAERAAKKAKLQSEIDDLKNRVSESDRLSAELRALDSRIGDLDTRSAALKEAERAAGDAKDATRLLLQQATAEVEGLRVAASKADELAGAAKAQKHAELERSRMAAQAQLNDVIAAENEETALRRLERELKEASEALESAGNAVGLAERAHEYATVRAAFDDLIQRDQAVTRAASQLALAKQRGQEASTALEAARRAVTEAEHRRDRREAEARSQEIKDAESEILLLRAVQSHIAIEALKALILARESDDERARTLRNGASKKREEATGIDERVAKLVLPTAEQVTAWRTLEQEMKANPVPDSSPPSSPLLTVILAFVVLLLVVAATTRFGFGGTPAVALLFGLAAALVGAGAIWAVLRIRVRAASLDYQQRTRHRERWTQEVLPSLRRASLTKLTDYDGAVLELERQRADARRLREEADREDLEAVDAERTVASLGSRREELARLERDAPTADAATVSARAATIDGDANRVDILVAELQRTLEATRSRLGELAQAEVSQAHGRWSTRQGEYELAARDVTAADTALSIAQQHGNPEELKRLRDRLDALGIVATPPATVAEARTSLDAAKTNLATLSAKADGLQVQCDTKRPAVEHRVAFLGGDLKSARQQAQQRLDAIEAELTGLDTVCDSDSASTALNDARIRHDELQQQLVRDKETADAAATHRSVAEGDLRTLGTEAATLRGQLAAIDRPALDAQLQKAINDPAFQVVEGSLTNLDAAKGTLAASQAKLERCTNDLNHAKGQLHLITGHVGTERLAQQQEAVDLAYEEVQEFERTERAARRLLLEIETVEADRSTHLGKELAAPIAQAFRELTEGRYDSISLTPDLKTDGIVVTGKTRALSALSVGTREQLATLLRLAIADHLQTALVLDDQLVHSDTGRLIWFRDRLCTSARERQHQVIIFTCRPGDYLPGEAEAAVSVVDLAALVSR
jgi:DNA repair exonuclease SbcCD ATPase subunit